MKLIYFIVYSLFIYSVSTINFIDFLRTKCLDTLDHNRTKIIFTTSHHLTLTFANSLQLPNTLHQILLTRAIWHTFQTEARKKIFIHSLRIIIWLFCVYACAQERFFCFEKKSPTAWNTYALGFIKKYHISILPGLKLHFNSSTFYQSLVSSVRP